MLLSPLHPVVSLQENKTTLASSENLVLEKGASNQAVENERSMNSPTSTPDTLKILSRPRQLRKHSHPKTWSVFRKVLSNEEQQKIKIKEWKR